MLSSPANSMIQSWYASLFEHPDFHSCFSDAFGGLDRRITDIIEQKNHGHLSQWLEVLAALPDLRASSHSLSTPVIRIGEQADLPSGQEGHLEELLRAFHPWRKGPFSLFGLHIDSEWRSDMKWSRLAPHISDLSGRRVLDIGSGNGYFSLRCAGAGAGLVMGVDPMMLFVMQFQAVKRYLPDSVPAYILPFGIEDLPAGSEAFDTVFSMGVFYHRRSPIDHLQELKACLREGGELVLETLVIEGGRDEVLVPDGRYARMRNVWFIPSCLALEAWLARCGFRDIRLVDVSRTALEEQRTTGWMTFESLAECLDSRDHNRTIEGYAAPRRAIFIAGK